jgi:hypothetical protein
MRCIGAARLGVCAFPAPEISPGATKVADSDGPLAHASASRLAPGRQHSPTGPLAINLPAAEGGMGLLSEYHRHLPTPILDTANTNTVIGDRQGISH